MHYKGFHVKFSLALSFLPASIMAVVAVFSAATCANAYVAFRPLPLSSRNLTTEFLERKRWLREKGISVSKASRMQKRGRSARRGGDLVSGELQEMEGEQRLRGMRAMAEGERPEDAAFMRRALELSRQALGRTSPNPMVGCVIVKDGAIIGEGWHPKAGEPHAEVFALRAAGKAAAGATAYVTLEPCNHHGRTPPCSQALVKARVRRVVVGTVDPNPLVGGEGVQTLRRAGVEVVVGVEEAACRRNVEAFMFRIANQRPYSILRYSLSLSGSLLPSIGTSGCAAGSYRSQLLAEYDAAVITDTDLLSAVAAAGSDGDAASSDSSTSPASLLSSEPDCQQPLRVVVARSLTHLPRSAPIFDTSLAPTLVVTSESAVVVDVSAAAATGRAAAEQWLGECGVDLVVLPDGFSPCDVMELCLERDCNSVLWDWHPVAQGAAGNSTSSSDGDGDSSSSGGEGWSLGSWLMEDDAVEKVVVALSPVLGGCAPREAASSNGGWLEGGVGEMFPLHGLHAHVCGEDVIVEGYVQK
ncbi:unnamed protein product [Closterium sp. Yama58-4]|nr:unnamed protein product [Closterium sp. Yama58-4]